MPKPDPDSESLVTYLHILSCLHIAIHIEKMVKFGMKYVKVYCFFPPKHAIQKETDPKEIY